MTKKKIEKQKMNEEDKIKKKLHQVLSPQTINNLWKAKKTNPGALLQRWNNNKKQFQQFVNKGTNT